MINDKYFFESFEVYNRVVSLPMEGADCNVDGSPTSDTIERYKSNILSGAGIIWFEASAVTNEGRSNIHQMMITKNNINSFKKMVKELKEFGLKENGFEPIFVVQLTHSGRQSFNPMVVYHNDLYEAKKPIKDSQIVSDEYLDSIPEIYKENAILAVEAGFDMIDVKTCHGYLMQEALSAFNRTGKYGGNFENRTRLYLNCLREVNEAIKDKATLVARIGVSDFVKYPYGFGTDSNGDIDYTEPFLLIEKMMDIGVKLFSLTIGNPYYNPHVNRPFRKGPYKSPETVEEGFQRFINVEKKIKERFPNILLVAAGLSCMRDTLFDKAEFILKEGLCDFVGFGRMMFAYPNFYKDYLNGNYNPKKGCVTCSRCTDLMRNGNIAGCAIFNDKFKTIYEENILCKK